MVKLTKEYLSVLQYLLYKAQKRQKIKQILKYQKIFYKSKSIILFILCSKSLILLERKKFQSYLSEPVFEKLLQIFILKKKIQIDSFFYFKCQSNKIHINCMNIEKFRCFSSYILFFNFIKKQIFFINGVFLYNTVKLSYLSFFNDFLYLSLLKIFQYEFLNFFYYYIFSLLLSNKNMLFFDINTKKIQILKKKSIMFFFNMASNYSLFNYRTFEFFYHHNFFIDNDKIQYKNSFYFDVLSNRKQQFFFYNKIKKEKIKMNKKKIFEKKNLLNFNKRILQLKKKHICHYSIIFYFPYLRQHCCHIFVKLLKAQFFNNFTKILLTQLNNTQKKILFFIFEPIWEACFEISLYNNRRGRSLYDAVEFLRLNLKKQPMFLFKIYVNFFDKFFYKETKQNLTFPTNFNIFSTNIKDQFSFFFSFFENIILYGIQKKYQNYYLITKQHIFLYQIIKIFRQNKQNKKIYFYKIFYNKNFFILSIQNKMSIKLKKNLLTNILYFKNIKYFLINYKHYIVQYYKNSYYKKNQKNIHFFALYWKNHLKSKNYLMKNFLIFSLSNFFFNKINNLKQRFFSLQLKKQSFSFYLQKLFSIFIPIKSNILQKEKEGVSFSLIFKDSSLLVSKNTFLFFLIRKNKKVFFETNLLIQWSNKKFNLFKKIQNNYILINKLKYNTYKLYEYNNINKITKNFVFSTKVDPAQYNYKILLKIHLYFLFGYFHCLGKLLNLYSFQSIFLKFLLFIENNLFYSDLIKKHLLFNKCFFIMYSCTLYGKSFSFYINSLQKMYILFLLEKNDIYLIWNIFIKYENQILFFNCNDIFLKSFQTILKKWMIFNRLFLDKNSQIWQQYKRNTKSFIFIYNDFFIPYFSLKKKIYLIVLNNFSNQKIFLNSEIKKKIIDLKEIVFNILWSIKFFIIKQKHTFLLYKKYLNGFSFFNFFMFHTKKNNKVIFSNLVFFWHFYYIQILIKFEYINSFLNYYQIYTFINKKNILWKNIQIKKISQFQFSQSLIFKYIDLILGKSNDFLNISINAPFFYKSKVNSFLLFKLIFSNILKDKYSLNFYNNIIKQQKLKKFYYFSIKPSKYHIQKHLFEIYHIVKKNPNKNQEYIILKLSRIIKNWCFYYQILTPTILYKYIDYLTLQILWKWACKRHYQKSKKWIKIKYFYKFNFIYNKFKKYSIDNSSEMFFYTQKKIVFASQQKSYFFLNKQNSDKILLKNLFDKEKENKEFSLNNKINNLECFNKISKKKIICLPNHTDIILIKHRLIQNDRSPFDSDFVYWFPRNLYDSY